MTVTCRRIGNCWLFSDGTVLPAVTGGSGAALEAPREDLIRMTSTVRAEDDGNTLVGYAAVFNRWAEIDSWEGRFKERIAPGAFKKTLAERSDQVKVLFNHGMDPTIGDKPLGKPSLIEEDSRGLRVEVPLDDTSYNSDIKALLRSGALDGMSFRMTVLDEKWEKLDAKLPERTITAVRLYEFGPVTFPAYDATKAGVRAHAPAAFEAWRSAAGVPKIDLPSEDDTEEAQPPPAGDDATGTEDTTGPDGQSTRSTEIPAPEPMTDYQPTRRPPLSRERREAQRGLVKAWLASVESRSA